MAVATARGVMGGYALPLFNAFLVEGLERLRGVGAGYGLSAVSALTLFLLHPSVNHYHTS